MRTFEDWNGQKWTASVVERPGPDYKGRYHFRLVPLDGDESRGVSLVDIRWNRERTAERTLETMSVVELRRRLRQALGRGVGAVAGGSAADG